MYEGLFDTLKVLFSTLVTLLRDNKMTRNILAILLTLYLITYTVISVFYFDTFSKEAIEFLKIISGLSGLLLFATLVSFTKLTLDSDGLTVQLNKIQQEREKIIEKITQTESNVIGTIQLSLNQITEYYTINLSQARSSYRWSITAIIVGLITLIAGAWLLFFQTTPNITVGIIIGISGILVEFIGASNIYIYNKSLSQLNKYFRELINIQDTMLAIELCERIDNDNPRKLEITEKIILNLMGRSSVRENLTADINSVVTGQVNGTGPTT